MYEPRFCNLCGKEIKSQTIFLCFTCKISIEMEYKNLRRLKEEQDELEELQLTKYNKMVKCV